MFGLFNTRDIEHPQIGTLKWRRGRWEGSLPLPELGTVRILIGGSKKGLLPEAEADTLRLAGVVLTWKAQIAQALFDHAEPYIAASDAEPHLGQNTINIQDAAAAWDKASLQAVVVEPMDGVMTTELCFTTAWDEEHTLGARFQRGQWLELCGSTLVP